MSSKRNVGGLIYCGDWREIPAREGDKATLVTEHGTLAHIRIDDGCWLLKITKSTHDSLSDDGKMAISPWWFPEAVDILLRLHLEEKSVAEY